ncbi:MAG TPA: hypothetical protein VMP68_24290 [Candidatus Eisenbacteria bacterium]|nr:hypothetical protein [Candidatus Eisenbacteria bacterium]
MKITQLQEFEDCNVNLRLADGEVLTVTTRHLDHEYEDVVVGVLSTNNPAQYKGPKESAYAIKAADIVTVEELTVVEQSE